MPVGTIVWTRTRPGARLGCADDAAKFTLYAIRLAAKFTVHTAWHSARRSARQFFGLRYSRASADDAGHLFTEEALVMRCNA
jgi:hypothetical protein